MIKKILLSALSIALALPLSVSFARLPNPILDVTTTVAGVPLALRVDNNIALAYAPVNMRIRRSGFAVIGDGGSAIYTTTSTPCSLNNGSGDGGGAQIALKVGGCANVDWSSVDNKADPVLWGAQFNGSASAAQDTLAVQAAILSAEPHVYIPTLAGSWYPNGCIVIPTGKVIDFEGQFGSGLQITVLPNLTTSQMPVSCSGMPHPGIFEITNSSGPTINGLNVNFVQDPNLGAASAAYTYPPLINAIGAARFRLYHTTCTNATICVDSHGGNVGGAIIDDINYNAYQYGIWIDGAIDTVRVRNPHWWPFNMTSPQFTAFSTGTVYGIYSGRMDDLVVSDGLFLGGYGIKTYYGTAATQGLTGTAATNANVGPTFGVVSGTDFDTFGGIDNQDGGFQLAGDTFSIGSTSSESIINRGSNSALFPAEITCAGCQFYNSVSPLPTISQVSGDGPYASLNISASFFNSGGADTDSIQTSNGNIVITGSTFNRNANANFTRPTIDVEFATRANVVGNFQNDKGSGTGTFVNIATDAFNKVAFNTAPGWAYTLAGASFQGAGSLTPTSGGGVYAGNN